MSRGFCVRPAVRPRPSRDIRQRHWPDRLRRHTSLALRKPTCSSRKEVGGHCVPARPEYMRIPVSAMLAVCCAAAAALAGCGSGSGPDALTAPTQVVRTSAGTVAYRELGSGSPAAAHRGSGRIHGRLAAEFRRRPGRPSHSCGLRQRRDRPDLCCLGAGFAERRSHGQPDERPDLRASATPPGRARMVNGRHDRAGSGCHPSGPGQPACPGRYHSRDREGTAPPRPTLQPCSP